jgi:replication-associated recombination protein RarA
MDLFERQYQQLRDRDAPLAARMRPRSLDEFIGQEGIVSPGRLLRRAIQADQLTSIIFYGSPGTGKTTLAQIIAINAVLAGVKEIREAVETAKVLRGKQGQRTILFIDEVHRFNKSQQDALLPWVENGTLTLIGATTENPYFEVNKALVSRSRLFQLKPLTARHLQQVLAQAIADSHRGYGERSIEITPTATDHWTNIANGDARTVLNALELAVETTTADENGTIYIDLAVAEASIQQRAVLYDKEGFGHGAGYAYPHAYREHWVAQQYLPTALQGQIFYDPSDQGYEGQLRDRLNQQREAQQAALMEQIDFAAEILSYSPTDTSTERWLQRTINQAGQQLAHIRDRIFSRTQIQRHHVLLDLQADSGLLTWEALRRVPEGGVFSITTTAIIAQQLQSQADALPQLSRPLILSSPLTQLTTILHQQTPDLKFDWIVGRNALSQATNKAAIAQQLSQVLTEQGKIVLVERLPQQGQRLYQWFLGITDVQLLEHWQTAEEAIYAAQTGDSLLNWGVPDWTETFTNSGFLVQTELETITQDIYVTPQLLDRWLTNNSSPPSYIDRLSPHLSKKAIGKIRSLMTERLTNQTKTWNSVVIYITAQLASTPCPHSQT